MSTRIEFALAPRDAADPAIVEHAARDAAGSPSGDVRIVRRSIDARGRQPVIRIVAEVTPLGNGESGMGIGPPPSKTSPKASPAAPSKTSPKAGPAAPSKTTPTASSQTSPTALIIGSGPAGYFAALELLRHGVKPIVLERGKDVRERRRDLKALMQESIVDPDSNYCFGEGGAGTYSDGKLYTRSSKRGNIQEILQTLVDHGAQPDILIDAHPHIGSNKLWRVVQNIRASIEGGGGEVRFGARVVDFLLDGEPGRPERIRGVVLADGTEAAGDAVILATGHSAQDIYEQCAKRGVTIEAKPFALGVRIEHPQALIDEIQYHQAPRDPYLPAASYSLTCQVDHRGVFSFCMCPGGLIVPAATAPGEIVVNGMSMSRRDSPFANSGMVVEVTEEHYVPTEPLSGLHFQASVEHAAFTSNGNGSQQAPAQRVVDFLEGRVSSTLPKTSYIPGHVSVDLHNVLPADIGQRLARGLRHFGKKMPGYVTNEAVVVGVESRTSSPVRIPRDRETYQHVQVQDLYPCGEGAGYAGGIVSAAMDGVNVARALAARIRA